MLPLLVCDDSTMARKQLIRALPPEWPVSITQASHGEEAMAAIRQGLGQVVLLDLTMPVMDGYQVLAQVREEGHACRILVVSGDIQDEARRRVAELGALDFIRKPATPEELRETLERLGFTNLHGVPSPKHMVDMLKHGRVKLIATEDLTLREELALGGLRVDDVQGHFAFMQSDYYIAFSPLTPPEQVDAWQRQLQAMRADGSLQRLRQRWLPQAERR